MSALRLEPEPASEEQVHPMLLAAQTASEIADADEAVAWRKMLEGYDRTTRARWVIAQASAAYARAVLVSVRHDLTP